MSPNPFEMGQLSRIRTEISSSGLLTPLEYLVLKRAYEMGYFEWPRRCSLEQLSRDLKLSKSTTLEHLRKAIRKLIGEYFIF
jgi:predicted DNA binding protein